MSSHSESENPVQVTPARYLKAENHFNDIVAFEQRDEVGGVWNYTGYISEPDQSDLTIPRTEPADDVENPLWNGRENGKKNRVFPSPIYDSLETNIPHTLMNYSDKPFPGDSPLFPPFSVVKQYLEEYSTDVRHHLQLGTQVVSVRSTKTDSNQTTEWNVKYVDLATGKELKRSFDAIICASGHYSDPYIPNIPGISDFAARFPGIISHSKYYRNASEYAKKVSILSSSTINEQGSTKLVSC